jgi:HEAT repeat protein
MKLLFARIPPAQQQLATSALHAAAARWPQLSRLLGFLPATPSGPIAAPASSFSGAKADEAPPTLAQPSRASSPAQPSQASHRPHLAQLRDASDYAERARAALALAKTVDAETTSALVAALRDPSSEVAAQAAEALGHHPGDQATAALQGVLENRDGFFNPMTRASAVRALGVLLPANHGLPVVSAVADVDALVSLAAIAALAERDESASADALMGVLENRAGFYLPLTRQAAARALTRLQNYEPERLRRMLEAEYDSAVRDALASLAN